MKLTPQRLAVLEYLENNIEHPSADDIFRDVSARFPTMSLATVYNTLEALRKRGELVELSIDPARKRFDPNPQPHNHLICTKCRKILDVYIEHKIVLPDNVLRNFEVTGSHVEFYGICPDCKKTDKESLAPQIN